MFLPFLLTPIVILSLNLNIVILPLIFENLVFIFKMKR